MRELVLAVAVLAAVALVVITVVVLLQRPPVIEYDDEAPTPAPETFVWAVCHSTRCGHTETKHDEIQPGRLMCQDCDRVVVTDS